MRNGNHRDVHIALRIVGADSPGENRGRSLGGFRLLDPIMPGLERSPPDRDSLASQAPSQQHINKLGQILFMPGLTGKKIFAMIRKNDWAVEESRLTQNSGEGLVVLSSNLRAAHGCGFGRLVSTNAGP
jgi:hypothetical protein